MGSLWVILADPFLAVLEIEIPGIIRTGHHAIPASYTPVVIYDYYAIVTLVCSPDGTDLGAWWFIAVIAQQDHGFLGSSGTDLALDFNFSDPVYIPPLIAVKSYVVLCSARIQTGRTT
jgi:hypothetical protein